MAVDFDFDWDNTKARSNVKKHGVTFDYASTVFFDEQRLDSFSRMQGQEERRFTIGKTAADEFLFVAYTWRYDGDQTFCRIISARKASQAERGRYSEIHGIG